MSDDKRRRARVQGGWAAPAKDVRSDRNKMKPAPAPAWLGRNIDQCKISPPQDSASHEEKKYVYHEPDEDIRRKPSERNILKAGVYDISATPAGVSRIRFFPNFLETEDADWMFEQLNTELPWKQRSDVKNEISYLQPRLTSWFGDLAYSYSGVTLQPNSQWTPTLNIIKEKLEGNTGLAFNSMLANLYRDGRDSVDWHSDDERSLGDQPTIASLSFGAIRNFELRKKPPPEDDGDYSFMPRVKIPLSHGSLLIMEGATQADWQHRIPKEYHDRGPRINLTFRVIYPSSNGS